MVAFRLMVSILLLVMSQGPHVLRAQSTVGLLLASPKATPGYNLIFPHNQSSVFLLDNCGRVVHQWVDDEIYRPGNAVYLLENGNLIKCKRFFSPVEDAIWAGGGGETVEVRDWDNVLLYSYTLNNEKFRLHHDVAPLPNGHILMISWELRSFEEAVAAGRDPESMIQNELWSEMILEWDPVQDSIVWEWHAWDHLVQEFDSGRNNFGRVGDHPELINVNYDEHDGHPDWLHINAIDYNPVLNQIMLSVPYFNELWVIDHSTTSEEAAAHTGGRSGMGGDILYRWGNPLAYDRGEASSQQLFFQHDTHWTDPTAEPGEDKFGMITLFNNRVNDSLSTGNVLSGAFDVAAHGYRMTGGTYEPAGFLHTITHPRQDPRSVSNSVSSTQVLSNGHVLLLAGRWGFAYEVTPDGEVVWEYVIPFRGGRPAQQGDTLEINNNITFHLKRYELGYPAFANRDFTASHFIESGTKPDICALTVGVAEVQPSRERLQVFPNPSRGQIQLHWEGGKSISGIVLDTRGQVVRRVELNGSEARIDLSGIQPGVYFLQVGSYPACKIVLIR